MNNRRRLLQTSLALGAMQLFPQLSFAQAKRLVFATFTGSWEEAKTRRLACAKLSCGNNYMAPSARLVCSRRRRLFIGSAPSGFRGGREGVGHGALCQG